MPARRFPPPWSVEEQDACFVVHDANSQDKCDVFVTLGVFFFGCCQPQFWAPHGSDINNAVKISLRLVLPKGATEMPVAATLDVCPTCKTIYEVVRHHIRPPADPVCETCQQTLPVADNNDWLTYHVRRSGEPRGQTRSARMRRGGLRPTSPTCLSFEPHFVCRKSLL
jgi:hypothetical protein